MIGYISVASALRVSQGRQNAVAIRSEPSELYKVPVGVVSGEPKAYRFIPKYATEEQKADPACWSVMISKPSQNWIDGFIVEELR